MEEVNRPVLALMRGIPASGKTTRALLLREQGYVRLNKDDLRSMAFAPGARGDERIVLKMRDAAVEAALSVGLSVVVDDTNINPVHVKSLRALAARFDADFQVLDVESDLEECLRRNALRERPVNENDIRKMHRDLTGHLKNGSYDDVDVVPFAWVGPGDPDLPHAIIVDIDGTLAHMVDRGPYDWQKVDGDAPDDTIARMVWNEMAHSWTEIILVSGRDGSCCEKTKKWLDSHSIAYDRLLMRPAGDSRKDTVVKHEIFMNEIHGRYHVLYVLDDRAAVVNMWRQIGLKCLQVEEGNF